MIRASAILWGLLALGVGTGLFVLKVEVQALEDKLTRLNAEIRRDRAAVHVLEAEWSYLNDPGPPARSSGTTARYGSIRAQPSEYHRAITPAPHSTTPPRA